MALEERRILVGLLEKGMFISRLDRDWVGTPFPFQGFRIQNDDDIELLGIYCTSVFVDVDKSASDPGIPLMSLGRPARNVFPPRGETYRDTVALHDELPQARAALDNLHQLAAGVEATVRAGRRLSSAEVSEAMGPMVESLLRNADALFWLLSLMRRDDYAYTHAVNCSALAAAFGRHLALPREVLVELATGGFLLDVGKAALPEGLLGHSGHLSIEAVAQMRSHVEEGVRVVERSGIKGKWVLDMVATHHERHDGSGYPGGLSGDRIPLAGRMGGVIDTYDAICSDRPHCRGESRHGALQAIYRACDQLYQGEVVEQFLQCLSVYPTGSLVELTSGEVAVVMAQNQARRLLPRVMLLLDSNKIRYRPFRDVDLMAISGGDAAASPVQIHSALEPGAYGLDPAELFLA